MSREIESIDSIVNKPFLVVKQPRKTGILSIMSSEHPRFAKVIKESNEYILLVYDTNNPDKNVDIILSNISKINEAVYARNKKLKLRYYDFINSDTLEITLMIPNIREYFVDRTTKKYSRNIMMLYNYNTQSLQLELEKSKVAMNVIMNYVNNRKPNKYITNANTMNKSNKKHFLYEPNKMNQNLAMRTSIGGKKKRKTASKPKRCTAKCASSGKRCKRTSTRAKCHQHRK